jgi:hypothetical protein
MLRYCGLCGYFERIKGEKSFGNCKAGHRASTNDTTFSTNTCDHFIHKRNFKDGKIVSLYEERASRQKYA